MPVKPYSSGDNRYPCLTYADAVVAAIDFSPYATVIALNAEISRALAAEALLAPKASPTLTGTATISDASDPKLAFARGTDTASIDVPASNSLSIAALAFGMRVDIAAGNTGYISLNSRSYFSKPQFKFVSSDITSTPYTYNNSGGISGIQRFVMKPGSAALSINSITGMFSGEVVWITIRNNSGGAITTTWNASLFFMSAWVDPSDNTEITIGFVYEYSVGFREISRTGEVPF